MKKNIIICVLLVLSIGVSAQTKIHVDERFELTSIVFRLTEDVAFVHSTPANYIADIDDYFLPYKSHELVEFVKKTMYAKPSLNMHSPHFWPVTSR